MITARLAAEVISLPSLPNSKRMKLIQLLVPIAAADPTILDTVLSRLLLVINSSDVSNFNKIEEIIKFGGKELSEEDYKHAASMLGVSVPVLKAVVTIETSGGGFFNDGRPKILFEAYWFSQYTNHQYDDSHGDISSRKWNRDLYGGGVGEYKRLEKAKALNESAALMSASWGLGQIMGGDFQAAGYSDVQSFVKDMYESEGKQLLAMVHFIKSNKADTALKTLNWEKFAEIYNGKEYAKNQYHTKLASAFQYYSTLA